MDEEISRRIFEQAISFWIAPEIEKRRKEGRLKEDFELKAAQIIISVGKKKSRISVRLNQEVNPVVIVTAKKDVQKGELVEFMPDEILGIQLKNSFKDAAHVTLLRFGNVWKIFFDFRYNKGKVSEHISASKEFFESAKKNFEEKRVRPFFEDAYASAELATMAILMLVPSKEIIFGKRHDKRRDALRSWATIGNAPQEYSELLDLLTVQRPSARYVTSKTYKKVDCEKILKTLSEMISFAEKEVS